MDKLSLEPHERHKPLDVLFSNFTDQFPKKYTDDVL